MSSRTTADRRTRLDLADLVDRVVDVGAVVSADATIGVADVPLIRLALRLVIASAERFDDDPGAAGSAAIGRTDDDVVTTGWHAPGPRHEGPRSVEPARAVSGGPAPAPPGPDDRSLPRPASPATGSGRPARHDAEREAATARGLAQLVLTVVELLREVLERQAIRRAEGDTLTDAQVERLGDTLLALDQRMDELVEIFDLDRDDLHLDLELLE